MTDLRTCALIPAYNEEGSVFEVVADTRKYVESVFVVDDCSTDDTNRLARMAGAVVLRNDRNMGKGFSLKRGFSFLLDNVYDAVVVLDADKQHLPEEIPRFVNKLNEGYDVVIGRRDFSKQGIPFKRKWGNKVSSGLFSFLLGIEIYDPECGFRGYRKEVLKEIISLSGRKGFSYESDSVAKLVMNRAKLAWVDISTIYLPGRVSKIKPVKHLIDMAGICWNIMRNHKE